MCGIIAYIGYYNNASEYIINGLNLLQNRGYDSAGITTQHIKDSCLNIITSKYANNENNKSLDILKNNIYKHINSNIGIGHTRWATHGKKSDINSHPHSDMDNIIYIVHNGIIDNYLELKQILIKNKYTFRSETDTEIIASLIAYYYKINNYCDFKKTLSQVNKILSGSYALVIFNKKEPNKLFLLKNSSPLLLGFNNKISIIASESLAFSNKVDNYLVLEDNDIISIKLDDYLNIHIEKDKDYVIHKVIKNTIELTPYPFVHWTIKEIMAQPLTCVKVLNMGRRIKNSEIILNGLNEYYDKILKLNNIIISGCGTSYNAGLIGYKYMKLLKSADNLQVIDASEYSDYELNIKENNGIILLSQSGETKDLHKLLNTTKKMNFLIIGIVNVINSLIARESDCGVYLNAGRENAVASTKSFTAQVIILALLALYLSQIKNKDDIKLLEIRKEIIVNINDLALDIENSIKNIEYCKKIANRLLDKKSCFILGTGLSETIAKESALKLKEISYIHAEGYSFASLKHGPFALIEKNTPIFILSPDIENSKKCNTIAEEVKCRGAMVILITSRDEENINLYDFIVKIPYNKYFGNILCNVIMQLIAYELSLLKGINPDMPRNLAKVVTVE